MPRSHTLLAPLLGLATTLSTGCDDPVSSKTGALQVEVMTIGREFGPNRYLLSLNGGSHRPIAIDGKVTLAGLPPGKASVKLEGEPTSCLVLRPNPRIVAITAGSTVSTFFRVGCSAMGSIQVTVVTTGPDPDPNGYNVTVTGKDGIHRWSAGVAANGTVSIPGVVAGDRVVRLGDVAANCDASGPGSRSVTVETRGTAALAFDVQCAPVTPLAYVTRDPSGATEIYLVNSNGTGATNLTSHPASDEDPAWAPDGRTLAFTSNRDGTREIYVMNADGSGVTRLTTQGAHHATWSPDGRKIAFTSSRDGNREIYRMNADGSGVVRLTFAAAADDQPAWSPDGGRIAFVSDRGGSAELYVMNADGSGVTRLTTQGAANPAWSPDSRKLAFTWPRCWGGSSSACEYFVYVLNTDSRDEPRALVTGYDPAWSPDGRMVAYTGFYCDPWGYDIEHCGFTGIEIMRQNGTDPVHVKDAAFQVAWRP